MSPPRSLQLVCKLQTQLSGIDLDASLASETGVDSRSEEVTGFVLRALLGRVLIESVSEMHTRHAILFHMVISDLSVHAAKAWLLVVSYVEVVRTRVPHASRDGKSRDSISICARWQQHRCMFRERTHCGS
jgi:hypothetical protein